MVNYSEDYFSEIRKIIEINDIRGYLNGKSVLITGPNGLICSAVADFLLVLRKDYHEDIKIYLAGRNKDKVIKRFYFYEEGKDYSFCSYDSTVDEEYDFCADYVIHGASNAGPSLFRTEPVETIMANIVGLNSLIKCAKKNDTQRLLYISSSEVYGKKKEPGAFKEDDYGFVDILDMRSAYPCAKRAAENLCIAAKNEYGLDTVIVRPGHIYGPTILDNDARASSEFTHNAAEGKNIVMKSRGTQLRSYCHCFDCASAIITVLLKGEKCNAYNISNPNSLCTISDIAEAFAKAAGTQVVIQEASETEKIGFNKMDNSSLTSDKLEKLGWIPCYNLEEGTRQTLRLYS